MNLKLFFKSMMRLACGFVWVLVLFWGCDPISERKQPPPSLYQLSQSDLNLSGEQLAKGYCATCHLMPDPTILDKKTWSTLLPDMRKRMGLYLEEDFGTAMPEDEGVPEGIYSKIPYITRENWEKLEAYYLANAPDTLLLQSIKETPKLGIPGFNLEVLNFKDTRSSLTTLLRIHPQTGDLWVGHRFRALYRLDSKNNFFQLDSLPTRVAPVDLIWNTPSSFDLLSMGKMDPSNDSIGLLSNFSFTANSWKEVPLIDQLMRPMDMEVADWNGDGKKDYVLCQFGNHVGKLSLFLSKEEGYTEVILKSDPGARRTIAVDYEGDGDLDLMVLFSQAKEGISLFENVGQGKFKEKQLLAFHPAFGSSDFRFEDLNGDDIPELVLVNGDNADQSQIFKPYHGLRIFERDAKGNYLESWFYPMHGASGLELGDFDQDGMMDVVAIAFFPDRKQISFQNLIYFKQSLSGVFHPYILKEQIADHWLTLTKGDLDLDGDEDLVLGTFAFNQLYQVPNSPWRPFVVLRNTLR
uniref:FG-GAP repeat domain-containing protein n=1 Tax=Algoriphagus sp. TaxID=1872435 RepID=UPI0040485108